MGTICGDLLNLCVCRVGRAPGHGRPDTLRVRGSRWAEMTRCLWRALCSPMHLPYSTTRRDPSASGAPRTPVGDAGPSPVAHTRTTAARRDLPDEGRHQCTESTLYTGHHWMECYIVKDGVCVARADEPVIIAWRDLVLDELIHWLMRPARGTILRRMVAALRGGLTIAPVMVGAGPWWRAS